MSDEISFGRWIQRRRKGLDLTQKALAQRVGCAPETLRKIEADARRPSRQVAERLADALELPAAERTSFVRAARAEFSMDRLAPPTQRVAQLAFAPAAAFPTGTVTFLFTAIDGSSELWELHPVAMHEALARHDAILRRLIDAYTGVIFKSSGDGVCAAFARALDALLASLATQRAFHDEGWGATGPLRVRMALHTGVADVRGGDYFGSPLSRVARLVTTGYGGQILLSRATQELIRDNLPTDIELRDLGMHRLKDLTRPEQIFQVMAADLPADFPPLKTLDGRLYNLPVQPTPLIGREADVAHMCALLHRPDVRLSTLTGSGGSGKTRLALQVAAELLNDFTDGVWFVDLAPISDPGLIAASVGQTLGMREASKQPILEVLKSYLRAKDLLLLLDNFEQIAEGAPLIGELLAAAPGLKVLVTSRMRLRLSGEHEHAVQPLALPDRTQVLELERLTQYEAVRLFVARAQAVKADFSVTNENAPAVAEICYQLDGLPLAIELAAVRVKLFPPEALRARLSNRLRFLTGGARDLPTRQQTIRNTIEWSYHLLNAGAQTLAARLGIFVGGCTLEAAEAVCNADDDLPIDVVDGIAVLVDQSLLRQMEGADGEPRFAMLETIREYALEQLAKSGEAHLVRQRHAGYYLALAEMAEPLVRGAQRKRWLGRLDSDHDNLRSALGWALERDLQTGLRLAAALYWFWRLRGYLSEGRTWLAQLLARPETPTNGVARAKALHGAGALAYFQGDQRVARILNEQSLELWQELEEHPDYANTLASLAWIASAQCDDDVANSFADRALALARKLGDRWETAWALLCRGHVYLSQGQHTLARAPLEASITLWRDLGDRWGLAWSLRNLGLVALNQGDFVRATDFFVECLPLVRETGDPHAITIILEGLGTIAYFHGDYERAHTWYVESIVLRRDLGNKDAVATTLRNLGDMARDQGNYAEAAALFAESLALLRETGHTKDIPYTLNGMGDLALYQGDVAQAAALYQEALVMLRDHHDSKGIAWTQRNLGRVAHTQGEDLLAATLFTESLAAFRQLHEGGDPFGINACLDGLGGIAGAQGQPERAARLFGAAQAMRGVGLQWPIGARVDYERDLAAVRAQLDEAPFVAAWAEGAAMTQEQAIAYALGTGD